LPTTTMPSEEETDANEFALPADSSEPSESEGVGEVTNRETATFPHNNQGEGVPLPNQPFPLPPHAAMIPPTPGHGVGGQQHQGLFPRGGTTTPGTQPNTRGGPT
jgi:hypothetical protein